VWLASRADAPVVGLVGLRMSGQHAGEIHDLWVSPERRGQGIGVQLMQACLGYCRDHGVLKTLLEVEGDQTAAIQLFEKVGFLLARSRKARAGERLEFYMDLYRDDSQSGD
jgi:mycothiol synthase